MYVMYVLKGLLVNGPYALITTSVSAELGTHRSLVSSSRALATVTAIVDGTGSVGAAVGPLLAGWLAGDSDWNKVGCLECRDTNIVYICISSPTAQVFSMLMWADILALVLLFR